MTPRPERAAAERWQDKSRRAPRTGARRTVLESIRRLPAYVRLLWGLMSDRRVSWVDKLLVGGAIAYIVMPYDLIPDFIPFLGEVDDLYVLMLALQRLISHAGPDVLADHWDGDPAELTPSSLRAVFLAAGFFLPFTIRHRLRRAFGGKRRLWRI